MKTKETFDKKQKREISKNILKALPDYHRQGIGRALFDCVISWAKERGYEFLQVKTLDESHHIS